MGALQVPFPVNPFAQSSCTKGSEQIGLMLETACWCSSCIAGVQRLVSIISTRSWLPESTACSQSLAWHGSRCSNEPEWSIWFLGMSDTWGIPWGTILSSPRLRAVLPLTSKLLPCVHSENCPVGTFWVRARYVTTWLQTSKTSLDLCSYKCGLGSFPLFLTIPWHI